MLSTKKKPSALPILPMVDITKDGVMDRWTTASRPARTPICSTLGRVMDTVSASHNPIQGENAK